VNDDAGCEVGGASVPPGGSQSGLPNLGSCMLAWAACVCAGNRGKRDVVGTRHFHVEVVLGLGER